MYAEPLKTFVLNRDDFEEANKTCDTGYSGPATFTEEVLNYFAMFADCVAFTETLQRHKEDFSSLLQHMADCYKALFADKSSCVTASVAIIHLLTQRTILRIFMH